MTATALAPGFIDPDLVPVGDWMPARYTRSLSGTEDFTTDADRLLAVVIAVWRTPEVETFLADVWQVWLLRHILETYPPDWPVEHLRGQLRFRQVVISMARQQGKSVFAAILAFYFLTMHVKGPRVVGLASRNEQAKIVYDRVKYVIGKRTDPNPRAPWLAEQIMATDSRGIKWRNGKGLYQTLPADEDRAQGEPISGCLYDELHLGLTALWDAIIEGQKARRNSLLVGITTAGDDDSDLLARLYDEGAASIEYAEACLAAGEWTSGDDERFGFFCWEAADDTLTEANVIRSGPAIACGRVPLDTTMTAARKRWKAPKDKEGVLGRDRVIRYTLNRFVEGAANSWASIKAWADQAAGEPVTDRHGPGVVYALQRTESWEWVTITATSKVDGRLVTEVVAALEDPDHDTLVKVCKALHRRGHGAAFAVERSRMKALGVSLREEGLEVWMLISGEVASAAATTRSAIARRKLDHPGDPLLTLQMRQARRRDLGDSWRLSWSLSTGDIDAVSATTLGVEVATNRPDNTIPIF